jgi:hypothetical protein
VRRVPREVEEALRGLAEPWEMKLGSKHVKILVRGQLAGILPLNGRCTDKRSTLNLVSQIRKVASTGLAARRG